MTAHPRLVVLDDHQLFAETLTLALTHGGYDARRVAVPVRRGDGAAVESLVRGVVDLEPAVALVDLDLGTFGNGLRLVRPLVAAGVAVLVITSAPRTRWGECLVHGAGSVVPKTMPLHDILVVVRRLVLDQPALSPAEFRELVEQWRADEAATESLRARLAGLSTREQEVLSHLMDGRTVREFARQHVVSEATVRTQIRAILNKLEVSSQLAAVVLATHAGWRFERH